LIPFFLGVAAVTLAAVAVGQRLARRKLTRWAAAQGFRLISCRGAPFWRGPRAWRRTENQEDYWIVVEDRAGQRREGWVLYTSPWHSLGRQKVEVRWDDDESS
jgi:hypothetical protein